MGNADVSMDEDNLEKAEEMDVDIDDDQWEDVEEEEEEIVENETPQPQPQPQPQPVNKNYSIARTLHRLLNRTKKPSATASTPADRIKTEKIDGKKSNETQAIPEVSKAAEPPGDDEPAVEIVENISCVKRNGQFEFQCFIDSCDFDTKLMPELFTHFEQHENAEWSGYCKTCCRSVHDQPVILEMELKHLNSVHCEKEADDVSTAAQPPKVLLKVRRLSGDKLSTPTTEADEAETLVSTATAPLGQATATASAEPAALLMNVLKPWITSGAFISKRPEDVEKMLRRISLCSLYKCMGTNCIFTTEDAAAMLVHLKNHEKLAEEEIAMTGKAGDTDSWLECPYCDEISASCALLVDHINSVHSNSIYQCNRCFYRSVARFNLYMHSKQCHGDNESDISIYHCKGDTLNTAEEMQTLPMGRTKFLKPVKCAVEGMTVLRFIFNLRDFRSLLMIFFHCR